MTAHREWRKAVSAWKQGRNGKATTLKATARYLHESADWPEIRDFLIEIGMNKDEILDWFADEDFPDFAEAVEEGWGWPDIED